MQSEQIDQLATALAKAQGMMKHAAKSKENPFFKSHYADLPAVMEACREALSKNAIALVQAFQFDGDLTWLETTIIHSSGQWMRSRYPVRPVKNDPQGIGSAQTYARRYAIMAMVGVVADDEDDDGEAAVGRNSNGQAKTAEPLKRPVAAKPEDEAKTFAAKATEAVKAFQTEGGLRKWEDNNRGGLDKLKVVDRKLYLDVEAIIAEQYARLSPLNA